MSTFKRTNKEKESLATKIGNFLQRSKDIYDAYRDRKTTEDFYIGRGKHYGSNKYQMSFIGKRKRYNFRHKIGRR